MHARTWVVRLCRILLTLFALIPPSASLAQSSQVTGWGRNDYGQASAPWWVTAVVSLSAGYYHNVELSSDGTVTTWGRDNYGQVSLQPMLSGVAAIAAGDYHSLALRSDGGGVAWGRNNWC